MVRNREVFERVRRRIATVWPMSDGDELGQRTDVVAIEVDRTSHVTVQFGDGVAGRFGVAELRLACPCADCVGKRQRTVSVQPGVERGDAVSITDAELAGAFGINLDWSDGHRTGIYAWSYLRDGLDAGSLGGIVDAG